MNDSWENKFWDLYRINQEVMLALNSRDGERRRKIDGWISSKNEQIDALVASTKEV